MDLETWRALAVSLFGHDPNCWKFRCPACGLVQSRRDFLDLGMHEQQADHITGFSCIRRWKDQECLHIGGPVDLVTGPGEIRHTFEFAYEESDHS